MPTIPTRQRDVGHVFASFLSLCAYTSLQQIIKKAGLENKYTPTDILEHYSKTYLIEQDTRNIATDIPKQTEDLEKHSNKTYPLKPKVKAKTDIPHVIF